MNETSSTPGDIHYASNGAGWRLALKRVANVAPARGRAPRPALIVPGYGMNSFIFGFHPRGPSLEAYLASRGIEVWSIDLRAQGRAKHDGGSDRYGLADLAIDDVGCAIRYVLDATSTGHREVDLIGCSLGTALAFAHLACVPGAPVHTVASIGGLVTWVKVPPLLRAAFAWPWLVERIRVRGTRALAHKAFPTLVKHAPKLLSLYLNATSTDCSQAATMVETVEDPNPFINAEIAHWIRRRDLIVRGVNVSQRLRGMRYPHLSILAKHDGIVPPETSRAVYEEIGSPDKALLEIGEAHAPIAHADLFLSTGAQETVFAPLADFLVARA